MIETLSQLALQQLVHLLRVGFAFAGFHDLANQGVEGLVLAGLVLLDVAGVGGNHFINDGFQCAGVVHLFQALGFDDGIDLAGLAAPQRIEYLACSIVADRAVADALDERGQLCAVNLGILDADFFAVEAA